MVEKSGSFGQGGAFGSNTVSNAGGAVSDILGGMSTAAGFRIQSAGQFAEAGEYGLAAKLARQNEKFTEESTNVKETMLNRDIEKTIGLQHEQGGALGFADSGSSLDLLADSAAQGSLSKALLGQQGLITEAGYTEQAKSYDAMQAAAIQAGTSEEGLANTAERNGWITGGIKGISAIATLF